MVYGTLAGVDYNLTLCRLQSRLQHMNHGQSRPLRYARVDFIPPVIGTLDLASETLNIFIAA